MWIIFLTILFLLMQNCLTTKLIDLPDSEEYEDGIKSFIKDIESSTPDYPLRKSSTERKSPGSKNIEKNSPGYQQSQYLSEKTGDSLEIEGTSADDLLRQFRGEETGGDSKEIERSSPNAKNTDDLKEKDGSSDNFLLSQSNTKQTRRVSVIEPQITLSREIKRSNPKKEKKLHRHRHHLSDRSSRYPSSQGSKEIAPHSPNYLSREFKFSRERASHNDDNRTLRRSNDLDKYENDKDENIKKKLTSLVEQTLHDTEKKIESVQGIKNANRELAPYKIGFILSMVKKSRDMLNELFNTAVKHRDSWKALEQLKIFELIAHTNVDTTNLVRQLVEIHIQHINSTMVHGNPAPPPRPEGDRKRVVML